MDKIGDDTGWPSYGHCGGGWAGKSLVGYKSYQTTAEQSVDHAISQLELKPFYLGLDMTPQLLILLLSLA
jgi:hypothetical protein